MATAASQGVKDFIFEWEGKDRNGKIVRGETRASGENQVQAMLRRQGALPSKIKKRRMSSGKKIKPKDIALFTRQMATMMKAGVPLLQAFDIVGRGNTNPSVGKLLNDIRADVETGTSLNAAFRKYPLYFDSLYCNLVEAGESAGILEALLDRLAMYMEKTEAISVDVPDLGGDCGLCCGHGDYDFCDPGLQGSVYLLWCGSACTYAVCDGHQRDFCQMVVADFWRDRR